MYWVIVVKRNIKILASYTGIYFRTIFSSNNSCFNLYSMCNFMIHSKFLLRKNAHCSHTSIYLYIYANVSIYVQIIYECVFIYVYTHLYKHLHISCTLAFYFSRLICFSITISVILLRYW